MFRTKAMVRNRALHWVVFAVQAIFTITLYAHTLRLGIMSEAWDRLEQAQRGLWIGLTTTFGWHYIPVASIVNVMAYSILGTSAFGYQAITIFLHIVVGHLVYRLGLVLLRDVPASLAASLLFLGSAAFNEITFWPIIGHSYVLAAAFFLLGLRTVIKMAGADSGPGARWELAGWYLASVLCYTGMVTLLPLAAIVLLLCRFRGLDGMPIRPWRKPREWLAVVVALLPCMVVMIIPFIARVCFFNIEMSAATYFRFDWLRVYFLDRGLLSVFSLRGSGSVLHGLVTLGSYVRSGPWLKALIWGWFALAVVLLVHSFRRSRSLAYPLLLFWLFLQLCLTATSLPVASRHIYLAAVPSALLTASALREVGLRLAARLRATATRRSVSLAPLALGSMLLLYGAWGDLREALDAGLQASDITRRAAADIRGWLKNRQGPVRVTLVDLPFSISSGAMSAYAFAYGTANMVRVVSGLRDVEVDFGSLKSATNAAAWGSRRLSDSELDAFALDQERIVLIYDSRTRSLRQPAARR